MNPPDGDKTGHQKREERKGHSGQSASGFGGPAGRELARRAGKASQAKGAGVRAKAEGGFGRALGIMLTELVRLWRQRQDHRKHKRGAVALSDTEEYRLWWLAKEIVAATKGVIPISATVDSRVDIPIIPAGVIELLRGIVPGREALELGEVVDAQARALPQEPRALAPGQQESKAQRKQRNRWEWQQKQEADRRARQGCAQALPQSHTPAPPPNDPPAPPTVPLPATQPDPSDPAPPTRPAPEVGDP